MSRLKSNRRVTSCRRASASLVLWRAAADSWLAMLATARKTNSATQFWGSAIVNVWNGGRRKKLNASIAATEIAMATRSRAEVAAASTTSRSSSAAMVGFGYVLQRSQAGDDHADGRGASRSQSGRRGATPSSRLARTRPARRAQRRVPAGAGKTRSPGRHFGPSRRTAVPATSPYQASSSQSASPAPESM